MSGLCGHLRLDGGSVRPADIDRQIAAQAHRGPDRRKAWHQGPVALGHLLLRVTPEDLGEVQPLRDAESGLVLSADLRLDNRDALASALGLSGADMVDWPDSRVLMAVWRRWGEDCLNRLVGDFAIAIWDERARRLTLARDPMGQRPLYLHHGPGILAFASEIKGLWALGDVPRELDEAFLAARVADYYMGQLDATPYRGIRMLGGGAVLSIDADGTVRERRYWEPRPDAAMLDRSDADYLEAYRSVLGEAVRCRLRSNRPAALSFSGGFDSGAIAALSEPALRAGGRKLLCLTSVTPEGQALPAGNRCAGPWVAHFARYMPHIDLRLLDGAGSNALDNLDQELATNDGLPILVNHYAVSQMMRVAAANGARTFMDGQGGDYTLNPRGIGFLPHLLATGQPRRFLHEFRCYRRTTGHGIWPTIRGQILRPIAPDWLLDLRDRLGGGGERDFGKALLQPGSATEDIHWPRDYRLRDRSLFLMRLVTRWSVAWDNNMAAAHGMDMTRPFHDRRVVELALAIPERLYVRDGWERHMVRTALRDLLPPECATRDRGNEIVAPDFYARHKPIQPRVTAELERLRQAGATEKWLNVDGAISLMQLPPQHRDASYGLAMGVHALLAARFVEWFQQTNR